jgi:molybdopterin molybdotransferase
MKEFFKVTDVKDVLGLLSSFRRVGAETVETLDSLNRILAEAIVAEEDLPPFPRTVVDGFAVKGTSTFGASESNPAYLEVVGSIAMGALPSMAVAAGQAARIATGGMLPAGADSVVMVEYTNSIDDTTIEVYRSVAPGQNVITSGEDFKKAATVLNKGQRIRTPALGLLSALGYRQVPVYRRPTVAVISTGDEIVPADQTPGPGQIRDINSYTLAAMVKSAGGNPVLYGIVPDNFHALQNVCQAAIKESDTVLISGGSSVGTRDFTIDVISSFDRAEILVHGISISPGKPTILARVQEKPFWGLPGHVVSSMIVFSRIVRPFINHIGGAVPEPVETTGLPARLSRNIASAQGRMDYIRVRLLRREDTLWAEPILGKSALINTLVRADGLIEVDRNIEGLERGTTVTVLPLE